jgi:hypothetical protein
MRPLRSALTVLLLVLAVGACGETGSGTEEVVSGPIAALPTVPDSELLDPPTESDGVTGASFVVDADSMDQLLATLAGELERQGWDQVGQYERVGEAFRGEFTTADEFLEVSAFPAQGLEDAYRNPIQYSYVHYEDPPSLGEAP